MKNKLIFFGINEILIVLDFSSVLNIILKKEQKKFFEQYREIENTEALAYNLK